MAAAPEDVNPVMENGYTSFDPHFIFDVSSMLDVGDTRNLHIHPDYVMKLAGVSDPDLINAHSMKISTTANGGAFSVSIFHTVKDAGNGQVKPVYAKLGRSTGMVDGGDENPHAITLHSGHHMTTMGERSESKVYNIVPSSGQLSAYEGERLIKRLSTKWNDLGPGNVDVAITKSTLDGEKRYVVGSHAADGAPSAIHRLLTGAEASVFGGKYAGEKGKTVGPDGKAAYELTGEHFKVLRKDLHNILRTETDFEGGLGVKLVRTKLAPVYSDADKYLTVKLDIGRHPFDARTGFKQAAPSKMLTQAHFDQLEGGVPITQTSAAMYGQRVVGFADKVLSDPDAASRVVTEAFVGGEDDEE
jgi:hypothetical protein